jgi:hypothetical protein
MELGERFGKRLLYEKATPHPDPKSAQGAISLLPRNRLLVSPDQLVGCRAWNLLRLQETGPSAPSTRTRKNGL